MLGGLPLKPSSVGPACPPTLLGGVGREGGTLPRYVRLVGVTVPGRCSVDDFPEIGEGWVCSPSIEGAGAGLLPPASSHSEVSSGRYLGGGRGSHTGREVEPVQRLSASPRSTPLTVWIALSTSIHAFVESWRAS